MTSLRRDFRVLDDAVSAALAIAGEGLAGTLDREGSAVEVEAEVRWLDAQRVVITQGDRVLRATVIRDGDVTYVAAEGRTYEVQGSEPGTGAAKAGGAEAAALSPMTGLLAKVAVAVGDAVAEGEELFVVEAMKMEYVVRAPRAVVVAEVTATAGEQVGMGDAVVVYGAEPEA